MKTSIKTTFIIIILAWGLNSLAQDFKEAFPYLEYISKKEKAISKESWDYTNAVAHGKSARKVTSRRKDLINEINESRKDVKKMPAFNGDGSFRDSAVAHLTLYYHVINEDFGKIMDLEDVADQSYDNMEAYILAQRIASEKLHESSQSFNEVYNSFAAANNINIIKSEDKLSKNIEKAGKVFDYYNDIFLILFKSQNQENYLIKALNANNVNALEQCRSSLLTFSSEGIAKLKETKSFEGDATVKISCTQLLTYYNMEAKDGTQPLIDYIVEKEKFNKIKAAFDAKKQESRTNSDIDQFNKAVNDLNAASDNYNKVNLDLNSKRSKAFENWTQSVDVFLDKHVPKK